MTRSRADNEWIGGRYKMPFEFREEGEHLQPEVIFWMALPSGFIVSTQVIHPREPVSFSEAFQLAMQPVNEGVLPGPTSIRVRTDSLAKELRRVAGGIPITVAPVPELDAVFRHMSATVGESRKASYLEGGIPAETVAEFFAAAEALFKIAPWDFVLEHQLVGVDIPKLKIKRACISVIGNAGESMGLLLFRSLEDYIAFGSRRPLGRRKGGFSVRSMSFSARKDLPSSMTREIKKHGWHVAGPRAYPTLFVLDGALDPLPLAADDYRIMTKLSEAFLVFFKNYRSIFETNEPEAIQPSFTDEDGVQITFTAPF
ncbi:MAG TPA: hypothetical protein VGQ46_24065 [Thermoanaerobaculia bacterium]|jgi:hypothetical protein|nr:hypothetical protein [Thermoanaerobaculia bacterium]